MTSPSIKYKCIAAVAQEAGRHGHSTEKKGETKTERGKREREREREGERERERGSIHKSLDSFLSCRSTGEPVPTLLYV